MDLLTHVMSSFVKFSVFISNTYTPKTQIIYKSVYNVLGIRFKINTKRRMWVTYLNKCLVSAPSLNKCLRDAFAIHLCYVLIMCCDNLPLQRQNFSSTVIDVAYNVIQKYATLTYCIAFYAQIWRKSTLTCRFLNDIDNSVRAITLSFGPPCMTPYARTLWAKTNRLHRQPTESLI